MRNQLKADLVKNDEDFEIDWKAALEMVDRREAAAKQVVPCEKCSSMQVQLVDWSSDLLKMKCRSCKHKFERKLK